MGLGCAGRRTRRRHDGGFRRYAFPFLDRFTDLKAVRARALWEQRPDLVPIIGRARLYFAIMAAHLGDPALAIDFLQAHTTRPSARGVEGTLTTLRMSPRISGTRSSRRVPGTDPWHRLIPPESVSQKRRFCIVPSMRPAGPRSSLEPSAFGVGPSSYDQATGWRQRQCASSGRHSSSRSP